MEITVRHNIEVAHRLSLTPGKCQNIHGHSMVVEMSISGFIDKTFKMNGMDLGDVKDSFREYLNSHFDHRLVLNAKDPLLTLYAPVDNDGVWPGEVYPGLMTVDGDPTIEFLALIVCQWAHDKYGYNEENHARQRVSVTIYETDTNSATVDNYRT